MKKSFKKEYDQFKKHKKNILEFFTVKGYNNLRVSEYAAMTGIPIYIVYYILMKNGYKCQNDFHRLIEYYNMEYDIGK